MAAAPRPGPEHSAPPLTLSVLIALWGLAYAAYRAYYGFGGTGGMVGTPASWSGWRQINLIGAAVLLAAAVVPVAALPLWRRPGWRRLLLGICWLVAVYFVAHALIQDVQRVASLAGALDIRYPAAEWVGVDRHAADVQDLVLNETWFLIEGLLWGALAWTALGRSRARRWWTLTACLAVAALTLLGVLQAFDVVGRVVVGQV
jgi:hypothetical protein